MKLNNGLTISLSNSKLGGFIPTLNLPPIITCRANAPCQKNCYACKGNFCYKNVKQSLMDNLTAYQKDSNAFFDSVIDFLQNGLIVYKFFRWHSSGDIIDRQYFDGVIKVANACQNTRFLIFTKKFEIVNDFLQDGGEIPQNLNIVFSAWDKGFSVPNPYNLPVAYVNFKDSTKNPEIPVTAFKCGGNCQSCLACWGICKGQATVFNQH